MADTDTQIGKTIDEGLANDQGFSSAKTAVRRRYMRTTRCLKHTAETTASTNSNEGFEYTGADDGTGGIRRVWKARIIPLGTLTADATDYANVIATYSNGNGGGNTTIASANTRPTANGGTGNWTALTVIDISPTAPVDVPASSLINLTLNKAGNGVNVPRMYLQLDYENI